MKLTKIQICWITEHKNIEEYEKPDLEAKKTIGTSIPNKSNSYNQKRCPIIIKPNVTTTGKQVTKIILPNILSSNQNYMKLNKMSRPGHIH